MLYYHKCTQNPFEGTYWNVGTSRKGNIVPWTVAGASPPPQPTIVVVIASHNVPTNVSLGTTNSCGHCLHEPKFTQHQLQHNIISMIMLH